MDETEPGFKPSYMSFQTFWNFVDELGKKPLPPQIDRSLMDTKSGTDQANLTLALKSFGLIRDDLSVEPLLTRLATSDEEGRKTVLSEIVERHYAEPLRVSAGNGTEKLLHDAFRDAYGLDAAETRRKAVTFFLHAARTAGIPLSPHFPATRSGPGSATATRKRGPKKKTGNGGNAGGLQETLQRPKAGGDSYTVRLSSGGEVTVSVSVNLFGLSAEDRDFVIELIDKLKGYPQTLESLEDLDSDQ